LGPPSVVVHLGSALSGRPPVRRRV
jgi:hypothetical protein